MDTHSNVMTLLRMMSSKKRQSKKVTYRKIPFMERSRNYKITETENRLTVAREDAEGQREVGLATKGQEGSLG